MAQPPISPQFLVTGAQGCIGAWVIYRLVTAGYQPFAFDLDPTPRRLRLIATPEEIERVHFVAGDITDGDHLMHIVLTQRITHIIHLAALQIPACRADPLLGARVNVLGTLNVFEAARRLRDQVQRVVYASSAAAFGPEEAYGPEAVPDTASLAPTTHYGVFKQCNEGNARVYWLEHGITSIGLRPWAVYGVGRDQGLTADPTRAILAALQGRPFRIGFGGRADMQYVDDVARVFIACALTPYQGAGVFNLRGDVVTVDELIEAIEAAVPGARQLITHGDQQIPIAPSLDDSGLRALLGKVPHTPLREGIACTAERFRQLLAEGRIGDISRDGRAT
ncbi:MAG: NAD(P)-dependent oxidoreductase [Anaerolineae bacterium]|nr:NAD(P)-dependent oxidoreductase [Anaerolineae bacterium]MDW8098684.1 NAD(P)-dependent oxidoreductase [Anaerolineae bacterium]